METDPIGVPACLEEKTLDLKRTSEIKKVVDSHSWTFQQFEELGEAGIVVRYRCAACSREWTMLLVRPEKVKEKYG